MSENKMGSTPMLTTSSGATTAAECQSLNPSPAKSAMETEVTPNIHKPYLEPPPFSLSSSQHPTTMSASSSNIGAVVHTDLPPLDTAMEFLDSTPMLQRINAASGLHKRKLPSQYLSLMMRNSLDELDHVSTASGSSPQNTTSSLPVSPMRLPEPLHKNNLTSPSASASQKSLSPSSRSPQITLTSDTTMTATTTSREAVLSPESRGGSKSSTSLSPMRKEKSAEVSVLSPSPMSSSASKDPKPKHASSNVVSKASNVTRLNQSAESLNPPNDAVPSSRLSVSSFAKKFENGHFQEEAAASSTPSGQVVEGSLSEKTSSISVRAQSMRIQSPFLEMEQQKVSPPKLLAGPRAINRVKASSFMSDIPKLVDQGNQETNKSPNRCAASLESTVKNHSNVSLESKSDIKNLEEIDINVKCNVKEMIKQFQQAS